MSPKSMYASNIAGAASEKKTNKKKANLVIIPKTFRETHPAMSFAKCFQTDKPCVHPGSWNVYAALYLLRSDETGNRLMQRGNISVNFVDKQPVLSSWGNVRNSSSLSNHSSPRRFIGTDYSSTGILRQALHDVSNCVGTFF